MTLLSVRRRAVLAGAAVALLAAGGAAADPPQRARAIRVSRDAGCGCCLAWVSYLHRSGSFAPTVVDEPDMLALKQRLGVPLDLASCHTAVVEELVVEGHVPAADILNALSAPRRGVLGLAVPGMPRGSPGMETRSGVRDAFDVIAFHADGSRTVFSRYAS